MLYKIGNCSNVIKFFNKVKKLKKFVLISKTAQKCENNANFVENYTLKLLIAF